ncbi:hypothetical protein TeGR_g3009 [Tetraparma gracilis]|uniref:Major facilitator superfamily (MFS) profile domain-containing protein n=1 Tax=Tetraparma gracilis TaxID=2962635 RepID=A0ABQ6M847_9STRA|nr:hypothetical protein TeGR_g3009 [Tetraparma gracilis]
MSSPLPCHARVHYSYSILLSATLAKICTAPGQSPGIGVVVPFLLADASLELTNTALTLIYLLATSLSALLLPFFGSLVSSRGVRLPAAGASLGLSLSCFLLAACASRPALFLAFFCLRFFGQGCLFTVAVTAINGWWVKKRGRAMGAAGAAVSAVMLGLLPLLLRRLIGDGGWRHA